MAFLCIDIGNTHTHYGIVGASDAAGGQAEVATRRLDHPTDGLTPRIAALCAQQVQAGDAVEAISFCSVVPSATILLRQLVGDMRLTIPLFQLTHERKLGIAISYPRAEEIGQDRLANAVAVAAFQRGLPAVVIDMGTAVTFDIVTRKNGYEGGIIAPGLELMRSYLHERTAQLPLLDGGMFFPGAIGHSTEEAMRIGTTVGFVGMIQALLDKVLSELEKRDEGTAAIYATGGCADYVKNNLKQPCEVAPDLTLIGLAAACRLNLNA